MHLQGFQSSITQYNINTDYFLHYILILLSCYTGFYHFIEDVNNTQMSIMSYFSLTGQNNELNVLN
jgi:cellulose synthase/poly-beta-1,6-N-acetylglucosamine synthase-like glycosyltransferase